MLLAGHWLLCDDGVLRPIFRGRMAALHGPMVSVEFLADPGADRTVLCVAIVARLGLPTVPAPVQLGGVGGSTVTVTIDMAIHLERNDGGTAVFRGKFAAFPEPEALDMSVIGRDISNLFALILDRPRDLVCMLGAGHTYSIIPAP
jgi:hypothetical protein